MAIADEFIAEMDLELPNTRKYLEIVPEDKFEFKPHEKSGSLIWLASHVADLPMFVSRIMELAELDLKLKPPRPPLPANRAELLNRFDRNCEEARKNLAGAADAYLMEKWRLRMGDAVIFELPRRMCLRVMTFNHMVHHRAQLGVYLRLLDVALPSIYGPTADSAVKI